MQFKKYLFIFNMPEISLTSNPPSPSIAIPITGPAQVDQSTQASFPVLLRSQQKALKRYATLAEIKTPKYPPSTALWSPHAGYVNNGFQGSTQNLSHTRAKSLHLNVDYNLVGAKANRVSTLNLATIDGTNQRHKLSTLNLAETPRSRLSTMTSSNTLSPKQYYGESPTSYAASEVSCNDRQPIGEGVIYSGQFKTVHQSKWRIGPDQPDSLSLSKTMCSCHDNPKELRHTNTPEGLSWRRLHMSRAKLKATATTSELLSGFAMVAMVELQINEPTTVPEWLFVLFAVCTTVLVAVHIFALMISTYILPNIDAISKLDVCELVTESPHERMRGFIELAWAFSTVLGLFLFLVEIAILCWVKFWDYSFTAAIAATVIVIPVLVMFVAFAVHFYHSLVVYKCDSSDTDIQQLENMKKELDLATSPV